MSSPTPPPYPNPATELPQHPKAIAVLVMGILSVMIWPLGFVAFFVGRRPSREIKQNPPQWSGQDFIKVGRVLGAVTASFTVLVAIAVIALAPLIMQAYDDFKAEIERSAASPISPSLPPGDPPVIPEDPSTLPTDPAKTLQDCLMLAADPTLTQDEAAQALAQCVAESEDPLWTENNDPQT